MILRDCITTEDGISGDEDAGQRRCDILCMRTCKGFQSQYSPMRDLLQLIQR